MLGKNSMSYNIKVMRLMEEEIKTRFRINEYDLHHQDNLRIINNFRSRRLREVRKSKISNLMTELNKKLFLYPLNKSPKIEIPKMTKYILV